MCGITGIIDSKSRPISQEVIKRMTMKVRHRGPDGQGVYFNSVAKSPGFKRGYAVAFGHARLKIIDLVTGDQPLSNEDGSIWIVCNGEIYNYQTLRKDLIALGHKFRTQSDTEVIIHAYETYGVNCLRYFRGMFAFALWDESNQRCLLARDRLGKKPLVYSIVDGQLVFASELKALLQHPLVGNEPDYEAIHHYLSYLCVPAPWTAFSEVKKLPPAHFLIYEKGDVTLERYWQLDFTKKRPIQKAEAIQEINRLLDESVKLRLRSDVPLGIFLSGGMDSSTIVAVASRLSSQRLKTFSIGFENTEFNELPYARAVARHFHTEHYEEIVRPDAITVIPHLVELYGEPFADSSALPTYYLAKMTKQTVSVALNGDGGDEAFGGYYRYLAMRLADFYCRFPRWFQDGFVKPASHFYSEKWPGGNRRLSLKRFLIVADQPRASRWGRWIGIFSDQIKRTLYTPTMNQRTKNINSIDLLLDHFTTVTELDGVDAGMAVDTVFSLPNDLLVKMDIATMAHGLEARSPFLDHILIEFMASLPATMKVRGLNLKYLLKTIQRKTLPSVNLKRQKQGFAVPIGHWFRGELRDWLTGVLLSSKLLKRDIFIPKAIEGLVQSHLKGIEDNAHQLWALLMLELWFEQMVDRLPTTEAIAGVDFVVL